MRSILHALISILVLAGTLAPVGPGAPVAHAQTTDERFFSETGFRIDDPAIWNYFNQRGAVSTFGFPISRTFNFLGFPTQFFQRKVVQVGENGDARFMNVLDPDLLGFASSINFSPIPPFDTELAASAPTVGSPNYDTAIIDFMRQNLPETFDGKPVSFFSTFQDTVTCEIAFPNQPCLENLLPGLNLEVWGSVISRPLVDPNNTNFVFLRLQRGVMHFQGVDAAGQPIVGGTLLGEQFKSLITGEGLPLDLRQQAQEANSRFLLQYCPGQPQALCRPAELPGTDFTNAFEQQQPIAGGGPVTAPTRGDFGYGYQVHLWHFDPQGKQLVAGMVREAGFNWMKHQVEWSTIEVAPGQYDWGELDAIVDAGASNNLRILLSVVHAPEFYRGGGRGLMPSDPARFGDFMQALASRYRGRVHAYELWNEQNLDREAGPGFVDPSGYLGILRDGYQGVKAGDPNALALFGALSPTGTSVPGSIMNDLEYLEQFYALNGGEGRQYFDALSAHPSGFSNPPDCGPETPQCSLSGGWNNHPSFFAFHRVDQYRDVMVRHGDAEKKIWFTEFGYGSTDLAVPGYEYATYLSEQQQGEFLVRAFQKARELDYVGAMFVWNLNYQLAVPKTDEKWAFGVVRSDWSPRPAYTMLANMPKR